MSNEMWHYHDMYEVLTKDVIKPFCELLKLHKVNFKKIVKCSIVQWESIYEKKSSNWQMV